MKKARTDRRAGKSASTQAGEFVKDEMDRIRKGEHGARSTKQAIAIGLSKARRAGVDLPPPKSGSKRTKEHAERDYEKGHSGHKSKPSPRRSRATLNALKRESTDAASHENLSKQAKQQAHKRTSSQRSAIAKKSAKTRMKNTTHAERSASARKAAKTRAKHGS
jgi:hypothetical protein